MRILFLAIINFIVFCNGSFAQNKILVAEGTSPSLYLTHKVAPKENFYSIGRLYNISPKEIAPYNNLTLEKGLNLGQTIKIPLTQNNFVQSATAGSSGVPVYHVIQSKEGLYHISEMYNKVPTDLLKKWNNLSGDDVSDGTKLIVGYLKAQGDQIISSQSASNSNPVIVTPKEEVKTSVTKTETPVNKEEMAKKAEPEKKMASAEKENNSQVKEEAKPADASAKMNSTDFKGGVFKGLYDDQVKKKTSVTENGTVGVFKTTSGWQDGKYYCFHNAAVPGTIIKVTNNVTGKSVYAKVLDLIPDIKQNAGLSLNISNAAAEELGETDNKFDCSFSYSK